MRQDPVSKAKAVSVLKKIPLFQGLTDSEYFQLFRVCRSRFLIPGAVLFREGARGNELFILLNGQVEIVTEDRGRVCSIEAGEVLGEVALVWQGARTASAVARETSTLLELAAETLTPFLEANPRIGYVVMRNIATTLAERLSRETHK